MMSSSQTAQGWHPNPMLMQPPPQHSQPGAPPPGWTGTWPPSNVSFPPGYPGPPPVPPGAGPHPHWGAGHWQFNPHAAPAPNGQNGQPQFWAPGMGWFPNQNQNQNQNHNPYKRVPKPPSPSYWNTKLTDNGLGLEGMVKRKDPSEYNGDEPYTPWIWNPPSLLESADRATPTRDFNPRRTGSLDGIRNTSTPTRDHGQSSRGITQEGSSTQAHSQTPQRSSSARADYFYSSRGSAQDTPTHAATSGSTRHASESALGSAGPSTSTSNHRSMTTVPPYPAPTPTGASHSRSAPAHQTMFTQEPESYTSSRELQPTFSSNIIRTPTHYQQAHRSADDAPLNHHSRSPSAAGHSSTPTRVEPLTRQASLPNSIPSSSREAYDMYSNFTEDMSSSLTSTTATRTRGATGATAPLSRSRTEPLLGANLTTIHESSGVVSSGEQYFAPLPDPSSSASSTDSSPEPSPRPRARRSPYESVSARPSPEHSPFYRDREHRPSPEHSPFYRDRERRPSPEHSPFYRDRDRERRPSPYASRISPSPSPRTHTQPYSSGGRRDNPLPPPPVERPTLDSSRPPVQEPPPAHYSHKRRMGMWNRRGDHLTPNMFVVYAPEDRAYPEELRDYPDEREGYMDQHGSFAPWLESRPELPASLPYHGRPPAQPYDMFVVYTYLP